MKSPEGALQETAYTQIGNKTSRRPYRAPHRGRSWYQGRRFALPLARIARRLQRRDSRWRHVSARTARHSPGTDSAHHERHETHGEKTREATRQSSFVSFAVHRIRAHPSHPCHRRSITFRIALTVGVIRSNRHRNFHKEFSADKARRSGRLSDKGTHKPHPGLRAKLLRPPQQH